MKRGNIEKQEGSSKGTMDYNWNDQEGLSKDNLECEDESMLYPDSKQKRRQRIAQKEVYDRYDDRVKVKTPKKPRVKNVKYYGYDEEYQE